MTFLAECEKSLKNGYTLNFGVDEHRFLVWLVISNFV